MEKENSCNKVCFCDEEAALFYIDKLQKTSKRKRIPVRAYLCDKCLTWHITSTKCYSYDSIKKLEGKVKRKENHINELNKINRNLKEKVENMTEEIYLLNRKIKVFENYQIKQMKNNQ